MSRNTSTHKLWNGANSHSEKHKNIYHLTSNSTSILLKQLQFSYKYVDAKWIKDRFSLFYTIMWKTGHLLNQSPIIGIMVQSYCAIIKKYSMDLILWEKKDVWYGMMLMIFSLVGEKPGYRRVCRVWLLFNKTMSFYLKVYTGRSRRMFIQS